MDLVEIFLKQIVLNMVESDFEEVFEIMNRGLTNVTNDMTITPSSWLGGSVWGFMEQIYSNVMIPVAALILTFILTVEIYHVVIERNAMKEIEMSALFMIFFKLIFGILIVSHASVIVSGLFDIGNWAVEQTMGIVPIAVNGPSGMAAQLKNNLDTRYGLGPIFGFWFTLSITKLIAHAINIIARVVVYGRLLQMVLYACFSPVPLATFMNKDWNVGQNYIKSLLALAFQGFLIVFIFGVYSIVVATPNINVTGGLADISVSFVGHIGWGVLLCMSLTKTNSITQSIFGAH